MQATQSWWLTHALMPVLLCVGLAAVFHFGNWDRAVAGAFYDSAGQTWLLDGPPGRALHGAQRLFIAAVVVTALALLTLRRWRRPASYLLVCLALTTSLVSLGKHATRVECARDLAEYGGSHRRGGQCFPAGHSSAALSLVALYFLLGERRAAMRWVGLVVAVGLGLAFAATQWARGMHVPSHDLASAAIAWAVALGAYTALYRRRLWDPRHAPAAD